jgi:hypothetical protein
MRMGPALVLDMRDVLEDTKEKVCQSQYQRLFHDFDNAWPIECDGRRIPKSPSFPHYTSPAATWLSNNGLLGRLANNSCLEYWSLRRHI